MIELNLQDHLIRCPHCEEQGCDGRCRFKVGRRGFLGLGLGAAAGVIVAPLLPAIVVPPPMFMPFILENLPLTMPLANARITNLTDALKRIYAAETFEYNFRTHTRRTRGKR